MMQVARKVPTDRPDVLMIIRVTYVLSQLLQVEYRESSSNVKTTQSATKSIFRGQQQQDMGTGRGPGESSTHYGPIEDQERAQGTRHKQNHSLFHTQKSGSKTRRRHI